MKSLSNEKTIDDLIVVQSKEILKTYCRVLKIIDDNQGLKALLVVFFCSLQIRTQQNQESISIHTLLDVKKHVLKLNK